MTTYYMLYARDAAGRWTPEFGDPVKSIVRAEREDYRDHGYKAKDLKIECVSPEQKEIDARTKYLNGGYGRY